MENDREYTDKEDIIPDYDHLFDESYTRQGKKKTPILNRLFKINFKPIILSSLVYLIQTAPVWVVPLLTSNIINLATENLTQGVAITWDFWKYIIINSAIILAVLLLNIPSTMLRMKIYSKMLRRTSAGLKYSVVKKLQGLSITYHRDMLSGKIQAKFLKDTESVDGFFSSIMQTMIPNVITILISTFISVYKNGFIALFFLVVIPINVALTFLFRKRIRNGWRDLRIESEKMSGKLTSMLEMTPVTKSHGLEKTEIESIKGSIQNVEHSGIKVDMITARFGAWSWAINTLLNAVCVIFCVILAVNHMIGVGDIVLYQSMFATISSYVLMIVSAMPVMASGKEALSSLSEIMNEKDVEINIGKKEVEKIEGNISFKNVSYKYPNGKRYVVKDFNLDVKKGECIAVVGASGSGKTTIMNLIIGFMYASKGQILIDGKDIKDIDLTMYRHNISVVPQNSILFSGTIKDNITYGLENYTEEDINRVVEMANLNEFLDQLPNGIDTDIGEHGGKLSGGQRQRITIARALIRNPKLLILDEATSALDNISEYHVQKAISRSIAGRTTFVVAHRLSTIRDANRIVVMENGECVEMGTYNELMEKKGKFFELKQLSEINMKEIEKL